VTLEELLVKMRGAWFRNARGDLGLEIDHVRLVVLKDGERWVARYTDGSDTVSDLGRFKTEAAARKALERVLTEAFEIYVRDFDSDWRNRDS